MKIAFPILSLLVLTASASAQHRLDEIDYAQLKQELSHVKYMSCPPKAAIRYKEKRRRGMPVKRRYKLSSGKFLFKTKYKYDGRELVAKKFTTPVLSIGPYVKSIFNYNEVGDIVLVDIMHRKDAGNRIYQTDIVKHISPTGNVTQKVSKSSWSSVSASQMAAISAKNTQAMMEQQRRSGDALLSALTNRSSRSETNGNPVVIVNDNHPSSCDRYYNYRHHYNAHNEASVPYYGGNPHHYSRFVDHKYAKVKYYYDSDNRLSKLTFRNRNNATVGYIRYRYHQSGHLYDVRFYWNNQLEKRFKFRFDNNRLIERAAYNGFGQLIYQ